MRIAYINKEDILNGPGIRVSLWTQGCSFNCPGCHNKQIQDFDGGIELTEEMIDELIQAINQPYIEGLSILGGEPLQQVPFELYCLCKKVKEETGKSIWIWTGYRYENIEEKKVPVMMYTDVFVDGPFLEDQEDATLLWRGSSNQRIIDVQESISTGQLSVIDQSTFL